MTATQVQQAINADPQRSGEVETEPRAMRPVWPLEVLAHDAGVGIVAVKGVSKIGWSAQEGTFFSWFAFNFGSGPLTTGGIVNIIAKHFGVWLRD